jgi:hypothetical protein
MDLTVINIQSSDRILSARLYRLQTTDVVGGADNVLVSVGVTVL